jgi:hypothetical protein
MKDKGKAIRCMVDVAGIPPSRFALPDDGRQQKHLCQQRWRLAVILARRADADGTDTYQSLRTLSALTEIPHRTLCRLLEDLRQLGVVEDHGYHPKFGTRIRSLHPEKLSQTLVPSSGADDGGLVPSSEGSCAIFGEDLCHLQGRLVPKSAAFGTHTALEPPTKPPTHTEQKRASESLQKENTFAHVAKYLELDMLTSQWKHGEMDKAEALIREHGWKKFYAAQRLYWEAQDPEQFSKTLFRWTGLLNSFAGLLQKVTPELLAYQDMDRFRKEHPEEWQRIQDESVERQTRQLVAEKFTNNTPKEPIAECTLDELMADDPEQWKKDNPEEWERLRYEERERRRSRQKAAGSE